ncbi:putative uncharacterized protein DDB_G0277255 [Aphidius gifuensis]|nr:putative uncharacterized protein DDB_G0277255 [Aphidius gifuensis]
MNPTKPEKKISRRSSILKLPKNKNPSEYGDQAVPAEESPRKDNRRVSFAGKKHVKEFCESNFQGTVWDNTYEESDSSHMKTSQTSLSDVTPPLNTTNENSPIENNSYQLITNQHLQNLPRATNYHLDESNDTLLLLANKRQLNRRNQLPLNNNGLDQFIDKENIPISIETEKIESSLVEDEIIQLSHKTIDKTDNMLPSFSIYCDDEEENKDLKCLENNDDTVIGELSMDCTLTANQLQISSDKCNNNNNNNSIDNINESKDMEITDNISSNIYKQENTIDNKTQYFEQNEMVMTVAVSSLLDKQKIIYDENDEITSNNRMSMTTAISSVLHRPLFNDQTRKLDQSQMEMTEAGPSLLCRQITDDQSQVINQNRMEINNANSAVFNNKKISDDQTKIFHENRMSITSAIPSVLHNQLGEDKTIFFQHERMDTTRVVPSHLQVMLYEQNQGCNQNRMSMTTMTPSVLQHQPTEENQQRANRQSIMEMTEPVASGLSQNNDEEASGVVNENRMSMTTMIPSMLQHQQLRNNQQRNNRQSMMEMTEAISSVLSQNNEEQSEVINQNQMSMTTAISSILQRQAIAVNQTINQNPMEFTEAIPSVLNQPKNTDNQSRMTVINSTSKSPSRLANQVPSTHNYLDEITDPSLSLKRNYGIIRSPHNSRNTELSSPYPKIQINKSSNVQKNTATDKDREKLHRVLHEGLSEVEYSPIPKQYKNISMELTTPVPTNYVIDQNSTDEMISVINEADNSKEINKQISTIVNSTIIPEMGDDKSIEINKNSSFVNSTINPEDNAADKNPIESADMSKIKNVINEEIIPAIERAEISSSLSIDKENHEPIDNNPSTNKSVARELFEINDNVALENLDNNHSSNSTNESIACRHYFDDNTADQITRPFASPSFNMNTETTKTIRIIPNCFENSEYNHSLTIPIQQSSTDNLDAIKEPSFFENSTESVDVNAVYGNEITANIKIWERQNIPQVKETIESGNKSVDDHQDNINNNEINSTDKTQENISVVNFSKATEKHNTSIIKINKTNKRRSLDMCDDEKISEKTKRFKLNNNNYYSQASNDESSSLKFIKKPEELLKNKETNKLPIEIIESLETKQFLAQNKLQLKNINAIIAKNTLFLNKVMKDIDDKKKELHYHEEKMNEFSIIGNKKIVLNDDLNLNVEENNDTSRFGVLKKNIKNYENKRECIWKIISIDSTRIIIEYYKTTIWLVIGFDVPDNTDELEMIKGVKIIPRLHPNEIVSLKITDKLIVDQIDLEYLKDNYKTYDDVMKMIEYVDDEVKSIYDFYFELIKLERKNLMDISLDKITFVSRTSKMRIILRVTVNVKIFSKITPDDITVDCLLGNVKHNDIKNLIKNVKKNYRFLKFYIDDVRNFIELLEEAQRPKNI